MAIGTGDQAPREKYPAWVRNDLERDYYDTEWGVPVTDERGMLERVCLEGFQSGLSWYTVLVKRPAFRELFANFVPDALVKFTNDDVERLLQDERIIRNHLKIQATISNALLTIELRDRAAAGTPRWRAFICQMVSGLSPGCQPSFGLSSPNAPLPRVNSARSPPRTTCPLLWRRLLRNWAENF